MVCPHIAAHLFIRAALSEANALGHQSSTVLEARDLKIEPEIGKLLLLNCNLCVYGLFTAILQALIKRDGGLD